MHPFFYPVISAYVKNSKHLDLKRAETTDEKIISNMPKDVKKALNVLCPKSVRVSIRAITTYAHELGEREIKARSNYENLCNQERNLSRSLFQAACKPYEYNYSDSGGEKAPHTHTVHFCERGKIPKSVLPAMKSFFKTFKKGKKKTKNQVKQVAAIDAAMRTALKRTKDVFWTLDGWYTDGHSSNKVIDLSTNQDYMKVFNEMVDAQKRLKDIQKEQDNLTEACSVSGISPFSGSRFWY